MSFLPWWGGALSLSAVTLVFWAWLKRPLGVSGSWASLLKIRELSAATKAAAAADASPDAFEAALLAETLKAFGGASPSPIAASTQVPSAPLATEPPPLSWTAHVTFLASLALGGAVAALLRGGFAAPSLALGPTFEHFFGAGGVAFVVLLVGGGLVGFGTRLGGGCTSGHALSGISRLQPGSLVGTAAFFGMGVVVSLLLEVLAR